MKSIIKKIKLRWLLCPIITISLISPSCNEYLDIVPDDGMATLESAFSMRSTAIRYLYTCYGFLTSEGSLDGNHGYITGDELWSIKDRRESLQWWSGNLFNIALGYQTASAPYGNDWGGMYEAIRCCNIMIEKIGTVPDLPEWERLQWIAEAKFLKAYYHFHLIRKWGPVPLIKESLPINASVEEVRVYRDPIDDCFDYVLQLLDESIPDLPLKVQSRDELGRITRPIAAALKAKISVYAASPLFNNNQEQASLKDKNGLKLFNTDKTPEQEKARWDSAVVACEKAIRICEEASIALHKHQSRVRLNDTIYLDLDLRTAFTEKWNDEIIWANTHSIANNIQNAAAANLAWSQYPDIPSLYNHIQAPLKIAEMFYTNHGLPIENDLAWSNVDPYALRNGGNTERWYIRKDYTTVELNFNREPRFYAWMGFDGGIWYGHKAETNDPIPGDLFWISCRAGQPQQKKGYDWGPVTGYYLKKVIHHENRQTGATAYDRVNYPWPMIRLADLYLLYAEAINESEGPNGAHSSDLFYYLDAVRSRAGLPDIKTAWDTYSNVPQRYNSQDGMKRIIHQERLIELSFEGQRFWDLRRWKEAHTEYAKGIYGFKVTASKPEDFYQKIFIADQKFSMKDYFWPIQTSLIEQNPNLVQNIGW
ncbi:MAG: RagB/SusD family nutrient uptake outer membrane protein [Bacteroidales bacterium]|jgi:hypothetical protein|nr:RagB/SusD family nutrient uptake outer membrane protein [Bacteroidales bacterium]